jgi:hypothetical protein
MPVRLVRPYNGQNANTVYSGTDENILRCIGIADDYVELAANYVPRETQVFRAFANTFSVAAPVGQVISTFSNPFAGQGRGVTTYALTGTVPGQIALSSTGRSLVVGASAATAGTIYTVNVVATSGDGLLTTQPATFSFGAVSQLATAGGSGGATPGPTPTPTPAANFVATDNTSWETAIASATAGQIIEIQANIPAPTTSKRLAVTPGVTIRPMAGNTYSVGTAGQTAGYSYNVDASAGQTALTVIATGVMYYVGNSYASGVPATNARGGWRFLCGKGQFNAGISGIRGAGAGNSVEVSIIFEDSAAYPVQFDCYGPTITNSGGDLVSTMGYGGFNTTVDQHNAASMVSVYDATVNTPGPQAIDNLATGHAGLPLRIFGGIWSGGKNGPLFRCNPVTTPLEIYGAVIDITGATLDSTQNGETISATKFVGNSVIGSVSATNYKILICPDGNNPTQRSCAIGNSSVVPLYNSYTHSLAPVFYRNTLAPYAALNASANAIVGLGDTTINVPVLGALSAYNKVSMNTSTVRNVAFRPAITWPIASNFEMVPTTVTGLESTAIAPTGGATVCHSWQWTGSGASKWAFRGDQGGSASSIVDCATKLTSDGTLLLPAGSSSGTATNCTIDGSTPSGASVGLAGRGSQLQSGIGLSLYNAVEAYLAANTGRTPGITGTYYTSVATPMASIS